MFETCVVEAWTGEQLLGRAPKLERLLGLGSGCEARPVGHHVVPGGVEAGHGLGHGRHGVQTWATPCWSLAPSHQGTRVSTTCLLLLAPEVPGQPPLEAGGLAAQLPPSDLLHYSNLGMSMMLMREIPHNSIETK